MKRAIQTLLVLATAAAVCSPAFAAGETKGSTVRALSSAAEPAHRADNTAAVASVMPSSDKKGRGLRHRSRSPEMGRRHVASGRRAISRICGARISSTSSCAAPVTPPPITRPRSRSSTTANASTARASAPSSCCSADGTMATSACAATAPATSSSSRAITETRCGRAHTRKPRVGLRHTAGIKLIQGLTPGMPTAPAASCSRRIWAPSTPLPGTRERPTPNKGEGIAVAPRCRTLELAGPANAIRTLQRRPEFGARHVDRSLAEVLIAEAASGAEGFRLQPGGPARP